MRCGRRTGGADAGAASPLLPVVIALGRLDPPTLAPPFARYAHGVAVPAGARRASCSGQLGIAADGTAPEGAEAQAALCFANVVAVLAEAIAVLPVVAIDQHGPHLPVDVDNFVMAGYLRATAARVPDDLPVLFLPVQPVGKSNEHLNSPGTLTFSDETMIRAWREIGEGVHRAGMRKLVLVNSHGGNMPAIEITVRSPCDRAIT